MNSRPTKHDAVADLLDVVADSLDASQANDIDAALFIADSIVEMSMAVAAVCTGECEEDNLSALIRKRAESVRSTQWVQSDGKQDTH